MPQKLSLNFMHFVNRSAGSWYFLPAWLLLACALSTLPGCGQRSTSQVEDSETSGRIRVVSVPEVRALMEREVAAFGREYPQASFDVATGTSREAVTALLEKRADMAVLTRELEPEERSVMVKGGMELEGYRFALDAICVIVNPANRVAQLSCDDLRQIYLGEVTDWAALGGHPGAIEPVVREPESDASQAFLQRVMGGANPTAPCALATSDSAVVARVLASPRAIGFVSMVQPVGDARLLRVSALTGLAYWIPDAEHVYKGDYPLGRHCSFYVRNDGPKLANGLVTFVSSLEGQKLVHEAGLVPTAVPIRFARRSPMLGSH